MEDSPFQDIYIVHLSYWNSSVSSQCWCHGRTFGRVESYFRSQNSLNTSGKALLPWHPKESNFQSGLSLEALPLLWKAERCGLHGQHWIVDALRALAAEDLGFLCFFLVLFTGSGSLWF